MSAQKNVNAVSYTEPFYRRRKLHFSCTQCGKCCTGGEGEFVFLCGDEFESIREHLQLSKAWFRRRYLSRSEGDLVLASHENGDCIFLQDGQCRVYGARPVQCRTYPFWPEIMKNSKRWAREAHQCEGINRGDAVKISVIEANIKAILQAIEESV